MENYLVTLIQKGNTITLANNYGVYQYSGIVKGKVAFTDNYFDDYITGVNIMIDKEVISLEYDSTTNEFILPYEFFSRRGKVGIAIYGTQEETTITSNRIDVIIKESLPLNADNTIPESAPWQLLVKQYTDEYLNEIITPMILDLLKEHIEAVLNNVY